MSKERGEHGEPRAEATETVGSVHAFREAEKNFQRRLRPQYVTRGKLVEEAVDLSTVVDLTIAAFDENGTHRNERWGGIVCQERRRTGSANDGGILVYSFERHPGFFVVRHAMDDVLANKFAALCFSSDVLRPPATTNFNKSHELWINNLWEAAESNLRLVVDAVDDENHMDEKQARTRTTKWASNGTGPRAADFLASLRWASIGPCYDWTKRVYLKDEDHVPLPEDMKSFAQHIWALVDDDTDRPSYAPNAALINYYREGDKLCGHTDDAEQDQTRPLVSISLGCPGVFLMGGEHKHIVPTPLILRHGDVAVLSGDARRAFHGLPRIFPQNRRHMLVNERGRPVQQRTGENEEEEKEEGEQRTFKSDEDKLPCCVRYGSEAGNLTTTPGLSPGLTRYLLDCRVNISIRQV